MAKAKSELFYGESTWIKTVIIFTSAILIVLGYAITIVSYGWIAETVGSIMYGVGLIVGASISVMPSQMQRFLDWVHASVINRKKEGDGVKPADLPNADLTSVDWTETTVSLRQLDNNESWCIRHQRSGNGTGVRIARGTYEVPEGTSFVALRIISEASAPLTKWTPLPMTVPADES